MVHMVAGVLSPIVRRHVRASCMLLAAPAALNPLAARAQVSLVAWLVGASLSSSFDLQNYYGSYLTTLGNLLIVVGFFSLFIAPQQVGEAFPSGPSLGCNHALTARPRAPCQLYIQKTQNKFCLVRMASCLPQRGRVSSRSGEGTSAK